MAVGIKMVQMINTKLQALPYHYIGGTVVSFSRRGRRALMMKLELAAPYYTGLQTLNPSPHISPEFQCRPRVLKPGFLSSSKLNNRLQGCEFRDSVSSGFGPQFRIQDVYLRGYT